MSMNQEMQHCFNCQKRTEYDFEWVEMTNGRKRKKGTCKVCGVKRALPHDSIPAGEHYLYFGKYEGSMLKDVPSSYLEWCMSNVNMNRALRDRFIEVLSERLGT